MIRASPHNTRRMKSNPTATQPTQPDPNNGSDSDSDTPSGEVEDV